MYCRDGFDYIVWRVYCKRSPPYTHASVRISSWHTQKRLCFVWYTIFIVYLHLDYILSLCRNPGNQRQYNLCVALASVIDPKMSPTSESIKQAQCQELQTTVESASGRYLCFTRLDGESLVVAASDGYDVWRLDMDGTELEAHSDLADTSLDAFLTKIRFVSTSAKWVPGN